MTITKIENILSEDEIKEYSAFWKSFRDKYVFETEYTTHSGMPVIGKVYQYKDKHLFRAHVFNKKLRKFDPYFISRKYIHPFWHGQHYFIVMEQMYHASSNLIRDNFKLVAKDIPEELNWRRPIFWDETISIELILEDLEEHKRYKKERGNFAFYNDKKSKVWSRMSIMTYWQPRAYIKEIESLKKGESYDLGSLIRKIDAQYINLHHRLIKPRKNLLATKDYLIKELKNGKIPEEELHDFFLLWDKPKS